MIAHPARCSQALARWGSVSGCPVLFRSSPRKRGGGFTFELQQFVEHLRGGGEVKALSRGVVVGAEEGMEARLAQGREVGLTRNEAAHAANGIFDAALLPRRIGIAEEGLNIDAMEPMMACERQQLFGDRLCGLIGRP